MRLGLRWKGLPHYVDVQSLQISLLAGRIFFGRVTYHGTNETITIVGGHITWRYWLRRVRHASVGVTKNGPDDGIEGGGGGAKSEELPCRVLVELKGVEWFVYNRSPAYDMIIEQMAATSQPDGMKDEDEDEETGRRKETGYSGNSGIYDASTSKAETLSAKVKSSIGSLMRGHEGSIGSELKVNEGQDTVFLGMLPIKVLINRGAVVMGNNNTPSILVAHFEKADATIDATRVCSFSANISLHFFLSPSLLINYQASSFLSVHDFITPGYFLFCPSSHVITYFFRVQPHLLQSLAHVLVFGGDKS